MQKPKDLRKIITNQSLIRFFIKKYLKVPNRFGSIHMFQNIVKMLE